MPPRICLPAARRVAAGDLDKALPLPRLQHRACLNRSKPNKRTADCYLRQGRIDQALAELPRGAAAFSEHAQTKRLVKALAGRQSSFSDRLAAAKALLDVGAFTEVESLLAPTLTEPLEPDQRHAARLLLIESRLSGADQAPDCFRGPAHRRGEPGSGPHRPGARRCGRSALVTAASSHELAQQAVEYVRQAGDLPAPWKSPRAGGESLPTWNKRSVLRRTPQNCVAALADVPRCGFRTTALAFCRARAVLMKAAWMRIERGDRGAALAIVWPMISDQPLPGADAALKPIKLSSGWLWSDTAASAIAVDIKRILSAVGKIEHNQTSVSASLLGSGAGR